MGPPPWPRPRPPRAASSGVLGSGALEAPPGRLQEDVVQRGPRDRDRADLDVGGVQPADDLRDRGRAVLDEERERVLLGDHAIQAGKLADHLLGALGVGTVELDRDHVLADLGLQALRASPAATISPCIDDREPLAELVGLLQVLGGEEDRRAASALMLRTSSQTVSREAGSRPVVGSSRKSTLRLVDERARQVEPPLHPAGVGLGAPVGGVGQPDQLEQLGGALTTGGAGDPVEAALELEQLPAGLDRIQADLLQRHADAAAHLRRRRRPRRGRRPIALPSVGGSSVHSILTMVDLPAPFGPRKPKTSPSETLEIDARARPRCRP